MKNILIKYFDDEIDKVELKENSDWCDLRSSITVDLKQGEFKLIPLGVGMKLPQGYEAHIVPRSSTFKHYGVIQTNGCGIVDNSYCGNDDQWFMPVFALRDAHIDKNDRICQFRIVEKQPSLLFTFVEELDGSNRGGHGSSGKQ
jgi:dUTP pyrophosphatase